MRHYPRLGGLILLAISGYLAKLCIYDPWQLARAGSSSVYLHEKGVTLSVAFALLSLSLVLFGSVIQGPLIVHPETRKLSPLGYVFSLGILAAGLIFDWWFKSKLGEMGYSF